MVTPFDVEDDREQYSLRPTTLKEYIGQKKVKANLDIFIKAAKKKERVFRSCAFLWTTWTR